MRKGYPNFKKRFNNESIDNGIFTNLNGLCRSIFLKKNISIVMIILFILIVLFRTFIINRVIVNGESMMPIFNDSDVCWVKKIDYDIQYDDVVIAQVNGAKIIKRVVALPGDTIQIKDGNVFINNQKYSGEFAYFTEEEGVAKNKLVLDDNEYFILGDNRQNSYDSRYCGAVHSSDIKGVVIAKIYPYFKIER